MKKFWRVSVEFEADVYADTEEAAEKKAHAIVRDMCVFEADVSAYEIPKPKDLSYVYDAPSEAEYAESVAIEEYNAKVRAEFDAHPKLEIEA